MDLEKIFWTGIVLNAIISAVLSRTVAQNKGYDADTWTGVGFLFGMLGLIASVGLPDRKAKTILGGHLKKCPQCAEKIQGEAFICKYCGNKFTQDEILKAALSQLKMIEVLNYRDEKYSTLINLATTIRSCPALWVSAELAFILHETQYKIKKEVIIELLAQLGDPRSIPHIIQSLNYETKPACTEALKSFGPVALTALVDYAKEANPREKQIIQEIIKDIQSKSI